MSLTPLASRHSRKGFAFLLAHACAVGLAIAPLSVPHAQNARAIADPAQPARTNSDPATTARADADAAKTAAFNADAARPGQIVAAGTVGDEATKAAVLARLREVYGADRVVDQIAIGNVTTPSNWGAYVQRLIAPILKQVGRGQIEIDGNIVSIKGEVPNEAVRQQLASDIATQLNTTYTVRNGLRVAASEQSVLDDALANRIVEFESGSSTLTPRGRAILDEMAKAMAKLGDRKIEVTGHTDNVGSRTTNLALSQARADAIVDYLAAKGIVKSALSASGAGPDRPVADNTASEGRARNRRIEFRVLR